MINLRGKIFVPLAILVISIAVYLYAVWLPRSIEFAMQESLRNLQHTLEIVEDQITPDLVDKRMDVVYQRLELILLKNPEWKELVLRGADGQSLYPVFSDAGNSLKVSATNRLVERDIHAYGKKIASLHLLYDFTTIDTQIRHHAVNLFILMIAGMLAFSAVLGAILSVFVIRPARLLAKAAEQISQTKDIHRAYDIPMPRAGRDEIGKLVTSFTDMRDTIKQKQVDLEQKNRDLASEKERAEAASQAKSLFLASMSHELRTPLNSILGLSRMAMEDDETSNAECLDMLGIINTSATSLLQIVNDILDISKIEDGGMELENIGFDFCETLDVTLSELAPLASKKGIQLNPHVTLDGMPPVLGDPLRTKRVLINLIENAIKYTNEGSVDVYALFEPVSDTQVQLVCRIVDTGVGIPEDKMATIFEKFTQADDAITRKFGGTGLGLAITRELVVMMGGKISVASKPDEGSCFRLQIPFEITDEVSEDLRQDEIRKAAHTQGGKPVSDAHILVAEDSELNQVFIHKLLNRLGIVSWDLARNGAEAVEMFSRGTYDAILMDCHMPEKSGYHATADIREWEQEHDAGRIPIVALTADAMLGTREKCLAAGMDEYVTKPIDKDTLEAVLSRWFLFEDGGSAASADLVAANDVDQVAAEALVDFSYLEEFSEGDRVTEAHFVEIFLEQSGQDIDALRCNCTEGENNAWVDTAHRLKGSAGMIGAVGLSKLCEQAQAMSDATAQQREQLLSEILCQHAHACEVLRHRITGEIVPA